MPDLVKLLEQWTVVAAAPIPFAMALVIIGGVIWAAVGWSYSARLSSKSAQKSAQIELQDRQLADYKQKLEGATPDQAKAKIEALESRLAAVEPRRLTPAQRSVLIAKLRPRAGAPAINIVGEASGDSPQLAADFASVFRSAGGWNIIESSAMGIGNKPPSGIALNSENPNSPEVILVSNALRAAGIEFEVRQGPGMSNAPLQMMICTKISR